MGSRSFPEWARDNEIAAIAVAVIVIVAGVITRPIYPFFFAKVGNYISARQIVRSSGLESFWPHTPDCKGKGWDGCVEELKTSKPENIRILAFTGGSTFSNRNSPLYDVLNHHQGNIEILLAQPGTPVFTQRLSQLKERLGISMDTLKRKCQDELEQSVQYCRELKETAPEVKRIEVRAYNTEPIWKMVILSNYLWLQYYRPGQVNDDMPAYGIRKSADSSLACPLQRVFENLWALNSKNILLKID
jgi:hypothetical protein